jgi:hypothetical protein
MAMTRRDLLRTVPIGVAGLAAGACGYSLAGRGSFLPSYIKSIGIPLFANRTPYATVEQLFTEKIRVEFQTRGHYIIKPTDAAVDGVVRGEITGISAAPVGFSDAQYANRYRFTVVVSVKFDDVTQTKTLWENAALTFSDEYELATRGGAILNAGNFLDQERAAVDRLSTDFARSVVSAILEAF